MQSFVQSTGAAYEDEAWGKMNNLSEPIIDQHVDLSVSQLLRRSILYHRLISELGDLFDVTLTPAMRAQAFQIVSDFAEEVEKQ